MVNKMNFSMVNTQFDMIKLKNSYIGNGTKVYLKEVFETNKFKIKEIYRLYVAYDKEIRKDIKIKISQEELENLTTLNNIYDISATILNQENLTTEEWNFLFEEMNVNFELNKYNNSKINLLKKINKSFIGDEFKSRDYSKIIDKISLATLNFCKNQIHINTFMTRKIKSQFFELDNLSFQTMNLLENVITKETFKRLEIIEDYNNSQFLGIENKINLIEDDIKIEAFDDPYLDEEEIFTSIYLDSSKNKTLDELLKEKMG